MTLEQFLTKRDQLLCEWLLSALGVHDINNVQQWRACFAKAQALTERALFADQTLPDAITADYARVVLQTEDAQAPLTLWEGRLGETWISFGPETFTIDDHHVFSIWPPSAAVKRMLEQRLGKHVRIEVHVLREGERIEPQTFSEK